MKTINPAQTGVRLNIAITSDNHIDTNYKRNDRRIKEVRKALKDMQESTARFDAYITVGDTTSRGGIDENWEAVGQCFEGLNPAEQVFFTLGNHDSWSKDGYEDFADGIQNFYKYSKSICNNDISTPYFSKIINGYHLIFLGTDEVPENEDCAAFSETEIDWFRSEMENAGKSGKPIFVFCHQSVNGLHGLPRTWAPKEDPTWGDEIGGIGKDSEEIVKILNQYKNVFYFSGHSHMGLNGEKSLKKRGISSFEKKGEVNYINLPCLTRPNHHGGDEKTGQGLLLEVYDDKVLIRPRNFFKRKMNKRILIRDGKPYLEEKIN